MVKPKRVHRPKDELKRELVEQLQLLRHSCQAFDSGLEAVAKHISLSLCVLLHHHGQSRALLDQLDLRGGRYLTSAPPLNSKNLLTECNLVLMHVGPTGARYLPLVADGGPPIPPQPIPFVDWWNNPVLKDNRGRTFCRRELVLNVADTDGGAHVDPEFEEAYMAISRANSLGWVFSADDGDSALAGRSELACMRQIAHELLATINQFVPEFGQHAQPVVPADAPQAALRRNRTLNTQKSLCIREHQSKKIQQNLVAPRGICWSTFLTKKVTMIFFGFWRSIIKISKPHSNAQRISLT